MYDVVTVNRQLIEQLTTDPPGLALRISVKATVCVMLKWK